MNLWLTPGNLSLTLPMQANTACLPCSALPAYHSATLFVCTWVSASEIFYYRWGDFYLNDSRMLVWRLWSTGWRMPVTTQRRPFVYNHVLFFPLSLCSVSNCHRWRCRTPFECGETRVETRLLARPRPIRRQFDAYFKSTENAKVLITFIYCWMNLNGHPKNPNAPGPRGLIYGPGHGNTLALSFAFLVLMSARLGQLMGKSCYQDGFKRAFGSSWFANIAGTIIWRFRWR